MITRSNLNIERLEAIVDQLADLGERVVLVGGCATGFLLTRFDGSFPPGLYKDDRGWVQWV
jgi:hypothetical protein